MQQIVVNSLMNIQKLLEPLHFLEAAKQRMFCSEIARLNAANCKQPFRTFNLFGIHQNRLILLYIAAGFLYSQRAFLHLMHNYWCSLISMNRMWLPPVKDHTRSCTVYAIFEDH